MNEIYFKIRKVIGDPRDDHFSGPHGPLCTRWLPNRKMNELEFEADALHSMSLYFDKFGVVDDSSMVNFKYRTPLDPNAKVNRQAILDAGPIFGFGSIEVSAETFEKVRLGDVGVEIELATGILEGVLIPLRSVIARIKYQFGQYWLSENLPEVIDQEIPLYDVCTSLSLKVSVDQEQWHKLCPSNGRNQSITGVVSSENTFSKYIKPEDWESLLDHYEPVLWERIFLRARESLDDRAFEYAVLDCFTALEILSADLVRKKSKELGLNDKRTNEQTNKRHARSWAHEKNPFSSKSKRREDNRIDSLSPEAQRSPCQNCPLWSYVRI